MNLLRQLIFCSIIIILTGSYVYTQQTIRTGFIHDGLNRSYSYYIPAKFKPGVPIPLVFNLHGYGSNGDQQEFYGDFRKIADTAGFIIVHPNGTVFPQTTQQFWNVGLVGTSNVDDVGFIHAIIDTLSKAYPIDPDRIYSTGMSNGGFMSYHLACTSTRFAAIASVAGSMTLVTLAQCRNAESIPIMEIHGDSDAVVNYNGSNGIQSIPQVLDYWIDKNGLDKQNVIQSMVPDINPTDGALAELSIYPGNHEVQHYKIINGAHTWPGSPFIIGTTCQDINASLEIWKFFNKYKRTIVSSDPLQLGQIELAPNPASEMIKIKGGPFLGSAPILFEVLNSYGKTVKNGLLNSGIQSISIQNLPSGIYFLKLIQDEKVALSSFLKI